MSNVTIAGWSVGSVDGVASVGKAREAYLATPNAHTLAAYHAAFYNALAAETALIPGAGAYFAALAVSADITDMKLNGFDPGKFITLMGNEVTELGQALTVVGLDAVPLTLGADWPVVVVGEAVDALGAILSTAGALTDWAAISKSILSGLQSLGLVKGSGSGENVPTQTANASASYSLINNGNGTFALLFADGSTFNYSATQQQWYVPGADITKGTTDVYTRNVNAGVSFGDWSHSQSFYVGDQIVSSMISEALAIPGESLTIATGSGSNPFITGKGETTAIPTGMSTTEAMAYFEATGTQVSFSDLTATSQGNAQTFTVYASAASSSTQTISLALSGGTGTYDILDMNTGKTYSLNGGAMNLLIPAGQDSATYTLIDASGSGTTDTVVLTASLTDANGTVTSNNLTVNFNDTIPAPGTAVDTINGQSVNNIIVTGFSPGDAANNEEWREVA